MKHKFLIHKDSEKNQLTIQEYAYLDRELRSREFMMIDTESFSLLCKETYDGKSMRSAIKKGKDAVVSELRTKKMFPIGLYADKIAESVLELYQSKNIDSLELLFDDKELLEINNSASDA